MTLYFVPVMYDLMHGKGRKERKKRHRKGQPSPLTEENVREIEEGM